MLSTNVTKTTGPLTLGPGHGTIFADATGGGYNVTLPPAATLPGAIYAVKKTDPSLNTVNVAPSPGDTVDGQSAYSLTYRHGAIVQSDGASGWFILAVF